MRATNAEGDGEWSAPGTGNTGSAASGKPEISGAAQAGQPLTADKGTVTDLNGTTRADSNEPGYRYTYQWILVEGVTETDIMGAMSDTYTPAASDVGKKIKVKLSFTDDADMDETATSDPVGPVGAALGTLPHDALRLVRDADRGGRWGAAGRILRLPERRSGVRKPRRRRHRVRRHVLHGRDSDGRRRDGDGGDRRRAGAARLGVQPGGNGVHGRRRFRTRHRRLPVGRAREFRMVRWPEGDGERESRQLRRHRQTQHHRHCSIWRDADRRQRHDRRPRRHDEGGQWRYGLRVHLGAHRRHDRGAHRPGRDR